MEHEFTKTIKRILEKNFVKLSETVLSKSELVQYINIKTKSANKGSKSRGSFANLYAIYVLVEDYISNGFHKKGNYKNYEGAIFSTLFNRQRELPFGQKLQNHALNHRMNEEFKKFFPNCEFVPILRDTTTNRYWFNQNLLKLQVGKKVLDLSESVIQIIEAYVEAKKSAFDRFIRFCEDAEKLNGEKLVEFITGLLEPSVDARIFEIVSFSILKYYYHNQKLYWGFDPEDLQEDNLKLYKTGRTNANDGGIDFVMKPLGRFFQVTETVDVKKYFLDIDKIEKFPITFVVKSSDPTDTIKQKIKEQAERQYSITAIVSRYMDCIEEVINIAELLVKFKLAVDKGFLNDILSEIIKQSRVEFNYEDEDYDVNQYENGVESEEK
ncbi:MAG: restriction endonuclease [Bacteroidetes bacterium]|nr:restriction endonuclease [Bacteroidota bacterium]MCL5737684.1 restriction endonuclease [Bacteroidota bacterium]